MPAAIPLIAGAFLAAGTVASAVGLGVAFAIAGTTITWTALMTVTGVALMGISMLSMKVPKPGSSGGQLDSKLDVKAPIPVAYGRTATGGFITYQDSFGKKNRFLAIAAVLSAGPIANIEAHYANDSRVLYSVNPTMTAAPSPGVGDGSKLYKNRLVARWMLGAAPATETMSQAIGQSLPGNPGKLSGLAHVINQYDYNQDAFPQGVPKSMWVLSGVKVYDPRKDSTYPGGSGSHRRDNHLTWEFSENPYLAALDWTRGRWWNGRKQYGIGSRWEEIDVQAFIIGANIADANGWKIGGVVTTEDDKFSVLATILQSGGGMPLAKSAQISCIVNAPKTSVFTLETSDLIGEVEVMNSTSWRDRVNTVVPSYREETQLWQIVNGEEVSSNVYVEEDAGEKKTVEVEYPLVQRAAQAHQLATYELCNSREFLTFNVQCKVRALNVRAGDAIAVNVPEIGAPGQKCLVIGREFNPSDLTVTLALKSETDAKHAFALGQSQVAPPAPALNGYDPSNPGAPDAAAWSVSGTELTAPDGSKIPAIVVAGEADDPNASAIIVEYRPSGAEWINYGEYSRLTKSIEITSVTAKTVYDVAISYRTVRGVISDRLTFTATAGAMAVDWGTGVVGGGKPQDGATVGAPVGTEVGGRPVTEVIKDIDDALDSQKDASGKIITAAQHLAAQKAASDEIKAARDEVAKARSDLSTEVAGVRVEVDAAKTEVAKVKSDQAAENARLAGEVDNAKSEAASARADGRQGIADAATVATNLNAEVERAKGVEGTINQKIVNVEQKTDTNATSIRDEITARADADAALANRSTALETNFKTLPTTFSVISRGYDDASSAGVREAGLYDAVGNRLYGGNRAWNVVTFNADNTVKEYRSFDTWDSDNNSRAMAEYLSSLPRGTTVVCYTYDEPQNNRKSYGLEPALLDCGAGPAYLSNNFAYRAAYVLIGRKGVGANGGTEAYSSSWVERRFDLLKGAANLTDSRALADASARITAEESARASGDEAVARRATALESRATTLEGQTGGLKSADILSRVSEEETTRAREHGALAGRVSTVEAAYQNADQVDSRATVIANAKVSVEEAARTSADNALANRLTTVESSTGSAIGLNANGDFAQAGAGWDAAAVDFPPLGGGRGYIASSRPGLTGSLLSAKMIRVSDLNRGLHIQSFFQVYGAKSSTYVGVQCFDAGGTHIGNVYVRSGVHNPGGYQVDVTMKGILPAGSPIFIGDTRFFDGTHYVKLLFFVNYNDNGGPFADAYTQITQFWLEDVGAVQKVDARVTEEVTTLTNANTALANRATKFEAQMNRSEPSELGRVLNNVDARIATEETVRANADSALANRSTSLESKFNRSGDLKVSVVAADSFVPSSVGDPATLPSAGVFGSTDIYGPHVEFDGGNASLRSLVPFARRSGLTLKLRARLWQTMGPPTAAVWYCEYLDAQYRTVAPAVIGPWRNINDQSFVHISEEYAAPFVEGAVWIRFSVLINRLPSDPGANYVAGAVTRVLEASVEDVTAIKVADIATNARITAEETTRADAISALASRSTALETSYGGLTKVIANDYFDNGIEGWTFDLNAIVVPSTGNRRNVIRTKPGTRYDGIMGRRIAISSDNQRWKLKASWRCTAGKSTYYFGVVFFDANDAHVSARDGTGNYPLGGNVVLDSAIHDWIDREAVIGKGIDRNSDYGGYLNIPAAAVYMRPVIFINYTSDPASVSEIDYFAVEEVTASEASNARIALEETARANADGAITTRIDTIVNTYSDSFADVRAAMGREEAARTSADGALASRNATLEAQVTGTVPSGLQTMIKDNRKNLADIGWWKKGAGIPWGLNGGRRNEIVEFPHGQNFGGIGLHDGSSGDAWLCEEDGNGNDGGGWNAGQIARLDPDRTYRFMVPIVALDDVPDRYSYWGTDGVAELNTGSAYGNPYFAVYRNLPKQKWHLFVGFIYPRNSVGHTHTGAGVWNMETGQKVGDGLCFNFMPDGRQPIHRAYQYYTTPGAYQAFGRPIVELVDGSESDFSSAFAAKRGVTDANARITAEETARSNADSALASRSSTLEAQMNRTSPSELGRVVNVVDARIATEESVRANADTALAQRSTMLEAYGSKSTGLLKNANFATLPNRDPGTLPTYWHNWASESPVARRWTVARGIESDWAMYDHVDQAGQQQGIYQDVQGGTGWYVLEATIEVWDGSLAGAGLLLYALDTAGNWQAQGLLHFAVDAPLGKSPQYITRADGTAGSATLRFAKLVNLAADDAGAGQRTANLRLYAMSNWPGFGGSAYKQMAWHKASFRPATDAEVKGHKALPIAENATARITTEEATRASADEALASRANVLEAQMRGATDSAIAAAVRDEASARVNADGALANRANTLEAQFRGDVDSPVFVRLRGEETARANADGALGSRIDSVQANYVSKSDLVADNMDFDFHASTPATQAWSPNLWGTGELDARVTKTVAWDNVSCLYWGVQGGRAEVYARKTIPVNPTLKYRMKARFGAYLTGGSGNTSRFYIGFVGLDAYGNPVDHGSHGSFRYAMTPGESIPDGQIVERSVIVTGEGNDSWLKFPPNTRQIRPLIFMNYDQANIFSYVDFISIEEVTEIDARVTAESTARANADGALATRATNVEARAGSLESRTGINESAIADAKNKLASARLELSAVTSGGRAAITLRSDNNAGAGVDIVGDVNFSGNLNVGPDSGQRVKITNSGVTVFDGNGTMRVRLGIW